MDKESMEHIMMERQGYKMTVNIVNWKGGEGVSCRFIIRQAEIVRQDYGTGLEIRDKLNPNALIKIGYTKLLRVKAMELEDFIITYVYNTLHIELAIKRKYLS
jgi:hypothetical protein